MPVTKKTKWREEYLLQIYELAKQGFSDKGIAQSLGVSWYTFATWKRKKPAVQEALRQAKEKPHATESFRDFVYGSLPPDLQKLWREINRVADAPSGRTRVQQLLSPVAKRNRQHLFLYALIHTNFNTTAACRKLNLPMGELENWKDEPQFVKLLHGMHQCKKDFFESHLMKLVKRGDSSAILFANRTINRDRGYNDKVEMSVSGEVQHQVSIEQLNLPIQLREQLLQAIRQKQLPKPVEVESIEDRK